MAFVVILVLAILWAAVLLPPILRARNESGGLPGGLGDVFSMVGSAFGRGRDVDPDLPGPLVGPVGPLGNMTASRSGMSHAQRRRRDILVGLMVAVGITLVMAVFSGGSVVFVGLQLATDAVLGAYVYLLLQFKARQDLRRSQVRPAPAAGRHLRPVPSFADATPVPEPALALRRTGSF